MQSGDSARNECVEDRVDLLDVDLEQWRTGWEHLSQSVQQAEELELHCAQLQRSWGQLELRVREQQLELTVLEQELMGTRAELDGARRLVDERNAALHRAAAEDEVLRSENSTLSARLAALEAAQRDSEKEWTARTEKERHDEMGCALKRSQEDAEQRRQHHAVLGALEQRLTSALAELEVSRGLAVSLEDATVQETFSSLHAAAEQLKLKLSQAESRCEYSEASLQRAQNELLQVVETSRVTAALLADERKAHAELLRRFERSDELMMDLNQALDEANAKASEVPWLKQLVLDLEAKVDEGRRSHLMAIDSCKRAGELEEMLASLSIEMEGLRSRLFESAASLSSSQTRLECALDEKERVVLDLAEAQHNKDQLVADLQQGQRVLLKTEEYLETHRQLLQAATTREGRVPALESRLQAQSLHIVRLEEELCNVTKELERSTTECVRLSKRLSEVERHDYGITSAVKALQLEAEEYERTFSPTRPSFSFSPNSELGVVRHLHSLHLSSLQGIRSPESGPQTPISQNAKAN